MEYKELFSIAHKKGITNIQVAETTNHTTQTEVINKELETYENSYTTTYNIKAEHNGKTVKLVSDYLDEDILDQIILKATYTDSIYEDEYLTDTSNNNKTDEKYIENEDNILTKLYDLDKYRNDEIYKLITYYTDNYEKKRIINSNNVDISTSSHYYEFYTETIVKKGEDYSSFNNTWLTVSKKDLTLDKYVLDTIEKAKKISSKNSIQTGKHDIIIDSTVLTTILSTFTNMISGENIRKKFSCLENKLGKKVFSDKLTIIEEPTKKKYPGYTLFDNEGTPTKNKIVVDEGKLNTYLYNIKEAKYVKQNSTGNGFNSISTRNMYIKPGNKSLEELFSTLNNGIYITELMGADNTSINANTGNISIQIFGFIIENGKIKSGFKPCILTTNIFELFSNIEEIGSDLRFTTIAVGCPSILIKEISIVGN